MCEEEIWKNLMRTLSPEALLIIDAEACRVPTLPPPSTGDVWTLSCGARFLWSGPAKNVLPDRMCDSCDCTKFEYGDLGMRVCVQCGEHHHSWDEEHDGFEWQQIEDL